MFHLQVLLIYVGMFTYLINRKYELTYAFLNRYCPMRNIFLLAVLAAVLISPAYADDPQAVNSTQLLENSSSQNASVTLENRLNKSYLTQPVTIK